MNGIIACVIKLIVDHKLDRQLQTLLLCPIQVLIIALVLYWPYSTSSHYTANKCSYDAY